MKTDALLCRALHQAGLVQQFTRALPTPSLLYPAGMHACVLRAREGEVQAQLRFAASELGLARIEMILLLPGDLEQADTVALYEWIQHVCDLQWPCHFSRLESSREIQVRAQVFTGQGLAGDEPVLEDMPVARDAASLARWLRIAHRCGRELLRVYAGKVS